MFGVGTFIRCEPLIAQVITQPGFETFAERAVEGTFSSESFPKHLSGAEVAIIQPSFQLDFPGIQWGRIIPCLYGAWICCAGQRCSALENHASLHVLKHLTM
jgi:hypothetical protein